MSFFDRLSVSGLLELCTQLLIKAQLWLVQSLRRINSSTNPSQTSRFSAHIMLDIGAPLLCLFCPSPSVVASLYLISIICIGLFYMITVLPPPSSMWRYRSLYEQKSLHVIILDLRYNSSPRTERHQADNFAAIM